MAEMKCRQEVNINIVQGSWSTSYPYLKNAGEILLMPGTGSQNAATGIFRFVMQYYSQTPIKGIFCRKIVSSHHFNSQFRKVVNNLAFKAINS